MSNTITLLNVKALYPNCSIIWGPYRFKNREHYCLKLGYRKSSITTAKLMMEIHLGRRLGRNEVVDHINDDKTDDRIENFQVLTVRGNSSKGKQSHKAQYSFICKICNKKFTRLQYVRVNNVSTCSRSCQAKLQHKLGRFR